MGAAAGPKIDREGLLVSFTPKSTILNPTQSDNTTTLKRTGADNRWMILTSSTYAFAAFDDSTEIYANGVLKDTLNKQEIKNINLVANDIVSSNKPISFSRLGSGQTGLCYAWSGTQFAHRIDRYNISFYIVATERPANVVITDSRDLTSNYWNGNVSTDSYTLVNVGDTDSQFILESDYPIAVYAGQLSSSDCIPLYPCSLEIFGTGSSSSHILAIEDNTSITEYSTDGNSRTYTVNRGGSYAGYQGGSQFEGVSVRLVADKPIAGESQADADGGEMTPYASKDAFGTRFVIPENEREFVKIVSDGPAVVITYRQDGSEIETVTLAGSSANKIYNARLTGESSYEGTMIVSDIPVYCVYEGEVDDETVLFASSTENAELLSSITPVIAPGVSNSLSRVPSTTPAFSVLLDKIFTLFNGASNFIDTRVEITSAQTEPLTATAWITTHSIGLEQYIIDATDFSLSLSTNNQITIYHNGNTQSFGSALNQEEWYHISYSYDGSSTGYVYLDGVLLGSITVAAGTQNSQNIVIGAKADNTGSYFSGEIDNTRVYNKYYSAQKVKRHYSAFRRRYK